MAPKRSSPLDNPPAVSSSEEEEEEEEEIDEEEEGSSEEEEEEEEEEEQQQQQQAKTSTAKPPPPPPPPPAKKPNESESESESGSESASESEDDNPPPVKPIASKPIKETPSKTTKSRSKPSESTPPATKKRGSEAEKDPKDSKRVKKNDSEGEKSKTPLFQRLWSEDDEIAVLEGAIDFKKEKGYNPSKNMLSFLNFIKKSLHFDVSLAQLKDKFGRLKKKFENNAKGKNGEDKKFSKPHEQLTFDLSKKIWGSDGFVSNCNAKPKYNDIKTLAAVKADLRMGSGDYNDMVDVDLHSHFTDLSLKKGSCILDEDKKAYLEEKWLKLHVAELELFIQRNQLITEQAKMTLAAYKSRS